MSKANSLEVSDLQLLPNSCFASGRDRSHCGQIADLLRCEWLDCNPNAPDTCEGTSDVVPFCHRRMQICHRWNKNTKWLREELVLFLSWVCTCAGAIWNANRNLVLKTANDLSIYLPFQKQHFSATRWTAMQNVTVTNHKGLKGWCFLLKVC